MQEEKKVLTARRLDFVWWGVALTMGKSHESKMDETRP
jgi:hypothetical protein